MKTRTGARTFLEIIRKACKLSHTPGFTNGVITILGPEEATPILAAWNIFCGLVETAMAADDFFNRLDATDPSVADSEDIIGR